MFSIRVKIENSEGSSVKTEDAKSLLNAKEGSVASNQFLHKSFDDVQERWLATSRSIFQFLNGKIEGSVNGHVGENESGPRASESVHVEKAPQTSFPTDAADEWPEAKKPTDNDIGYQFYAPSMMLVISCVNVNNKDSSNKAILFHDVEDENLGCVSVKTSKRKIVQLEPEPVMLEGNGKYEFKWNNSSWLLWDPTKCAGTVPFLTLDDAFDLVAQVLELATTLSVRLEGKGVVQAISVDCSILLTAPPGNKEAAFITNQFIWMF
ncbi:hypothetical protein L1987_61889 [Smallanthus sonchifolius]|uniref:Uncharacterized protein n=1 Tax=Smallanthus sonchifolius TaxID=185202 RepID=A0ACB9C8U9_9ASTR|nr:hypothetical protein L1987_61889 [Smallanthus sonchifolius]